MHYNKLVRDKIPEVIAERGGSSKTHIADEAEYWLKLKEKLSEEVGEFLASESAEEIADVLEVLEAIEKHKGFTEEGIRDIKERKFQERGGFSKRLILEESE